MTEPKSTRLIAGGRPPVVRDAVYATIRANPAVGLRSVDIVELIGCTPDAARDALLKLRARGLVWWLQRDRQMLHFGSQEDRDAYAAAHPAYGCGTEAGLREVMVSRRAAILAFVQAGPEIGVTAAEIAQAVDASAQIVRHMLHDLVRCGELFGHGPARKIRWFGSSEAMRAGKPLIDAMHEARRAEIVAHKVKAGQTRSERSKKEPPGRKFSVAAKATQDKAAVERIKAQKAPAIIVGMETAKRTECRPCQVERYRVDGPIAGGFASLGVGRYLE